MKNVTLLDGGVGQEIYRRAGKPADPLWATRVMMNQPDIVKNVHQDFISAGASMITINSYTSTPTRLERDGKLRWFDKLQRQASAIAAAARDELGNSAADVQIAGCLPPLVGSYVANERSFSDLKQEYEQIVAIQAPEVDVLLIETMSNIVEAKAALAAAMPSNKPVCLSFTLSDANPNQLRSGESMKEALDAIAAEDVNAILLNCSFPETINEGLMALKHLNKPYGGYANGFTTVEPLEPGGTVDMLSARKDLDEKQYAQHAMNWVKNGATITGGCCEIGPAHIAYLRRQLEVEGYHIVSFIMLFTICSSLFAI